MLAYFSKVCGMFLSVATPLSACLLPPQTPHSAFRPTPSHCLIATPPSILKVKPTSTDNTQEMEEEEEEGEGRGDHQKGEEEEQQVTPVLHRKIRCVFVVCYCLVISSKL